MKENITIISIESQKTLSKYLENLIVFAKECNCVAIIDVSEQDNQKIIESIGMEYYHCQSEADKIAAFNNLISKSITSEKDVFLLCGDLLHNFTTDTCFYHELKDALYYEEKHGFVSPRIDSVDDPIFFRKQLKLLSQFCITLNPDTRCVLVKNRVLRLLVNFDNSYASFYYAFLDFVQRANLFGFNSIQSNHTFLSSTGKNLKENMETLDDEKMFLEKYPYYMHVKENIKLYNKHWFDRFLPLLSKVRAKKRILFNYLIMPSIHCGTSELQLAVADEFCRLYQDKYDIYIYTNREASDFHNLSEKFPNVLFPDTISGIFDLGFCANQPFYLNEGILMNQYCLKSIYTILDIIYLRCNYLGNMLPNFLDIAELCFQSSDGFIAISDFSAQDYKSFFAEETGIQDIPVKSIYIASDFEITEDKYNLPFGDFILIAGNQHFRHKALLETIEIVADSEFNFIIIGSSESDYITDNIYGYSSGNLSEDFISYLYARCTLLILPSVYEGFGLPIAMSLKNNKRVILYNCKLNQELFEHFHEFKDYFYFFDSFSQINEIISSVDLSIKLPPVEYTDSWEKTAIEIEAFFEEILNTDIDPTRMKKRDALFGLLKSREHSINLLETRETELNIALDVLNTELISLKSKPYYRISTAIKNRLRSSFPRFFSLLKKLAKK